MPERLTPRERQCVQLAGEGLSNKEIARRLNIRSDKTVSNHLSSAYQKLGVVNRYEASALLGDYPDSPIPISRRPGRAPHRPATDALSPGDSDRRPAVSTRSQLPPLPESRLVRLVWVLGFFLLFSMLALLGVSAVNTAQMIFDHQPPGVER